MSLPKTADEFFDFMENNFGRIFIGVAVVVVLFWVAVITAVIIGVVAL